jgi:two-component system nitrate/nitrite response regulator NarL
MITCVLVDDHPAVLSAIVELLAADGIVVAACASTGAEAIPVVRGADAVVVTDFRLSDMTGLDLAREILRTDPRRGVVLYTATITAIGIAEARAIGVRAIVLKDSLAAELSSAIRAVAAGGSYIGARIAR